MGQQAGYGLGRGHQQSQLVRKEGGEEAKWLLLEHQIRGPALPCETRGGTVTEERRGESSGPEHKGAWRWRIASMGWVGPHPLGHPAYLPSGWRAGVIPRRSLCSPRGGREWLLWIKSYQDMERWGRRSHAE